jgi:DNA-directed RNA polymerase specialized sigma24 family protein
VPQAPRGSIRAVDPAEEVALVARARRELLLRVHGHRLRREDLEDCYSQATLELLAHARKGGRFFSRAHVQNALEQRFLSRVLDRRRALEGRSPMQAALERARSLGDDLEERREIVDVKAELERLVILRQELRRLGSIAGELSSDQRLVLVSQIGGMSRAEFCRRYGWSPEKYRKVAQRGRARLRRLMYAEEPVEERTVPPAADGRKGRQGPAYDHDSPHP